MPEAVSFCQPKRWERLKFTIRRRLPTVVKTTTTQTPIKTDSSRSRTPGMVAIRACSGGGPWGCGGARPPKPTPPGGKRGKKGGGGPPPPLKWGFCPRPWWGGGGRGGVFYHPQEGGGGGPGPPPPRGGGPKAKTGSRWRRLTFRAEIKKRRSRRGKVKRRRISWTRAKTLSSWAAS